MGLDLLRGIAGAGSARKGRPLRAGNFSNLFVQFVFLTKRFQTRSDSPRLSICPGPRALIETPELWPHWNMFMRIVG